MNLREAAAVAKQQVNDLLAPDIPANVRLEHYLYDDHLGIWSLTIGFALPNRAEEPRSFKTVRVSQADKSVLSVKDG